MQNCLNCKWEPDWEDKFTGVFRDRKEVFSYGCEYPVDCDCQFPIGHKVNIIIPFIYVEDNKVFWNGEYEKHQEITTCPAWQAKV